VTVFKQPQCVVDVKICHEAKVMLWLLKEMTTMSSDFMNRINIEREGAKSGQEQRAQKMVSVSNSSLPAVDIGTNVVVRVPDLDQGLLALRNVLASIVDVNSSGLYLLGMKEGLLERLYARNEFTTADNNFIKVHDVPSSSLSLRSASVIMYGSKQGFVSCHCKRYCIDKKCKCRFEKYEV